MRRFIVPWLALVVTLGLTAVASWRVWAAERDRERARFERAVQAAQDRIDERMAIYLGLLQGTAGLFASSDVTVERFHRYVEQLALLERYPGAQGLGYSARIEPLTTVAELTARMRREGRPDFRVWPTRPGAEHHAILHLEPENTRNATAIGFDMASDPTRRAAMERARDTGRPAMSGRVVLLQEIHAEKQPGFLIYVPVYQGAGVPDSIPERRVRLIGFAYSPFRSGDLFDGIFRREGPGVAFELYDGAPVPANLLYDSGHSQTAEHTLVRTVEIAEHVWTVRFSSLPGPTRWAMWLIVPLGVLLSLGLFLASYLLERARSVQHEQRRLYEAVFQHAPVAITVFDQLGEIVQTNRAARDMADIPLGEHSLAHRPAQALRRMDGTSYAPADAPGARALRGETLTNEPMLFQRSPTQVRVLDASAGPVRDEAGEIVGAVLLVNDVTERHRAEAEREAAETRYALASRATSDAIWDWDLAAQTISWNPGVTKLFGYASEDIGSGLTWWAERVHPEDRERVLASIQDTLAGSGEFWQESYRFRTKVGRYVEVSDRGYVVRDEHGRALRMVGAIQDVSTLLAKERLIQIIADNATVGLFMADERQHCTFMNRAAEQITGVTLAEIQGRPLHEVVHHTRPDGRPFPIEECPIVRALPQRSRQSGEEVFVRPDGTFYPVAFTASPIVQDECPVGTVIEVRDLTREKQAQRAYQALLALEQDARALAEAASVRLAAVAAVSRALPETAVGLQTVLDRAAEALPRDYADGVSIALLEEGGLVIHAMHAPDPDSERAAYALLAPPDARAGQGILAAVARTGVSRLLSRADVATWVDALGREDGPDGAPRPHSLMVAAMRGSGGAILGTVSLARHRPGAPFTGDDLATLEEIAQRLGLSIENARLHEQTHAALVESRNMVRFTELFVGMLGHDLRNPLSAIISGIDVLLQRVTDERLARPLERMRSSGQRMARMIDQILDFTRSRMGGGIPIRPARCDLARICEEVVDELRHAHPAARLELESTGDTTGAWDPDRMAQVFSNLAGNAIQHSILAEARIVIDGSRPDRVVASIHNVGVIPDSVRPVLFDPFRGGQRHERAPHGLGLGLYITEQIVKGHGGRIAVASDEARGTTFTVELPRVAPGLAEMPAGPAELVAGPVS
jgi:PAS domain S-box-containing protein